MQSGKYIAISALAFSLMPTLAFGDNLKTMIMTAITEGKSTGYLNDDLVKGFASQTKSNEPVQINMERIQKYSDKCAELAIMTSQPGVPQKDGKMGVANLMFSCQFVWMVPILNHLRRWIRSGRKRQWISVVKQRGKDG